jgi:hypothetical protein
MQTLPASTSILATVLIDTSQTLETEPHGRSLAEKREDLDALG